MRLPLALLFVPASLLTSCGKKSPADAGAEPTGVAADVLGALDSSVGPCEDFYQYACGTWLATTTIPSDRVWWSRSFSTINERNEAMIRALLEGAAKDPGEDPTRQQVGAFYGACMDEAAIESLGAAPLAPWLEQVAGVSDAASLMTTAGALSAAGVNTLLQVAVYPDFKDPSLTISHFTQGGLGLPDREYYLRDGDDDKALLELYKGHIATMLKLAGVEESDAADQAARVLAFETALAEALLAIEDLRDPEKTYHRIDREGLVALTPDLDWAGYFTGMGYPDLQQINVEVPDYFKGLAAAANQAEPATLQAYLRYHLISDMAQHLSKTFADEDFAFYGQTLFGQAEQKPRWRRCLAMTEGAMGEVLGRAYVAEAFPAESKETAVSMIQGIETAFEASLEDIGWMDDATRTAAVEKAKKLTNKIGYPDQWRDWTGLSLSPTDHVGNVIAANGFNHRYAGDKIGEPVDRGEWHMPPHMVNAYYNPLNNEMVFPAGILQPPFFDAGYPTAINYGGIGMVMGHELTHGFDDQGRKFDGDGRMETWWGDEAIGRFEEAAQCVVDQYAGFEAQPGLFLNGQLTLGENLADMGGAKQAYLAWKASGTAPAEPSVQGLTEDQLFFVAFAQGWCSLVTPEAEKVMVTVNPHSPPKFRVNGPLQNLSSFHEAFSCAEGTPMHPASTCSVW